jgi:hypothetical protein
LTAAIQNREAGESALDEDEKINSGPLFSGATLYPSGTEAEKNISSRVDAESAEKATANQVGEK